eukprot:COSAG05_NODE_2382_length_3145_cov_3.646422_1_plen_63_part_10
MHMIITSYSHTKHHLRLGELMHGNKHLLPPNLGESKFVLTYRAAAAQVTCLSSRELKHVTWAA